MTILVFATLACESTPGSPSPSEPAASEPTSATEPPTPFVGKVTGTVTYRERIALTPNALVEVKLIDISRADAPAVTIGELNIKNPGQVPISFQIEYDPSAIDQRFVYAVQVRIMEGDQLAFINDTRYQVITRDSPTHVDMVLVKVGRTVPTPPAQGHIAFTSNRDGNFEIYVMNADGSGLARLTNNSATDLMPSWSPDGQKIAFHSGHVPSSGVRVRHPVDIV